MCRTAGDSSFNKCVLENGKNLTRLYLCLSLRRLSALLNPFLAFAKFNLDIVVGLGGCASVAPIIITKLHSIPTLIIRTKCHTCVGQIDSCLNGLMKYIVIGEGLSSGSTKPKVVRVTGTPIRKDILCNQEAVLLEEFGLSPS